MRMLHGPRIKDAVCPGCGKIGHIYRHKRQVAVTGNLDSKIVLLVQRTMRHCDKCGAVFENTQDGDWRAEAYEAMKKMEEWT